MEHFYSNIYTTWFMITLVTSCIIKTSNEMTRRRTEMKDNKKKIFSDIITCIYVNFNRTHNNTHKLSIIEVECVDFLI